MLGNLLGNLLAGNQLYDWSCHTGAGAGAADVKKKQERALYC